MVKRNTTTVKYRPDFSRKQSLNLKEAAEYIKLEAGRDMARATLRGLANKGVIHCDRVQNGKSGRLTYYFPKTELDAWIRGENTANAIDLNSLRINIVDFIKALTADEKAKIIDCLK